MKRPYFMGQGKFQRWHTEDYLNSKPCLHHIFYEKLKVIFCTFLCAAKKIQCQQHSRAAKHPKGNITTLGWNGFLYSMTLRISSCLSTIHHKRGGSVLLNTITPHYDLKFLKRCALLIILQYLRRQIKPTTKPTTRRLITWR